MTCDTSGSLNQTPDSTLKKYVTPDLCVGEFTLQNTGDDKFQEQVAAESLNRSGAPINVFKLLGVHEQGKMLDVTGNGSPLNNSAFAFDSLAPNYVSPETGTAVTQTPAWIGYDFGVMKTDYTNSQLTNSPTYLPEIPLAQVITSFRITQPTTGARALQVRVESSNGEFFVNPLNVFFSGIGNGGFGNFTPGIHCNTGSFMLSALSATQFSVFWTGNNSLLGVATVGTRFNSLIGSFIINAGSIPFAVNDMFSIPVSVKWNRVDVVNLLDNSAPQLISIKETVGARYWRIVPTLFTGTGSWEVAKLDFFDYKTTRLDSIQDHLFLENRDRDYANTSIELKVAYQPIESISSLGKWGFDLADTYVFSTVFASMISAIGRPLVIGDIIEIPAERQYDHNLMPVRKFIEVTETNWAAEGYTTEWRPIIFKFQGSQAMPSQENKDIFGSSNNRFTIDDLQFLGQAETVQSAPFISTEINTQEAVNDAPKKGTNSLPVASGTDRFHMPGSYDGTGLYVEDAIPPDGQAYTEGFKLPTPPITDGTFFRLIYDPALKIPAKLYKYNATRGKWIYVETDRRKDRTSFKPSQVDILKSTNQSLTNGNL